MNANELLEMANLDVMGLLDPSEREAFERALRAAPPALQAQVRREQLRLTQMDDLLPKVELPVGLRARVLSAVREAMQQVAGGRERAASIAGGSDGVIGQLRPATGVSRLWRTAAIGALAACLALGFVSLQIRSSVIEMEQVARNSVVATYMQAEFGRQFTPRFFDSTTRFVKFSTQPAADAVATRPSSSQRPSRATLLFDPATKSAQLFCVDLPTDEREFEVVVIDRNGKAERAVLTFIPSNAGIVNKTIDGLDLENAKGLIIRQQGTAKPLLSSLDL